MNANAGQVANRRGSMSYSQSVPFSAASGGSEDYENETFVWGTNIRAQKVSRDFVNFFELFIEQGGFEAKYITLMRELPAGQGQVNVDSYDIYAYDPELYKMLIKYPAEMITLMDDAVKLAYADATQQNAEDVTLQANVFNLREKKVIRDLNPEDIEQLVSVSGMVTRCSNIIPEIREACFVCEKCGHEEMVPSQLGHLEEPLLCGNQMCRAKWTMKMVHNRSTFHNKQIVKMQENPNAIPEGETPHNVTLLCYDPLVDVTKPGDRITVTGIYRAHGLRVNPRLRMLKTVYKANVDIIHVQRDETSSLFSVSERISAGADSQFGSESQADDPMAPDAAGTETREERESKQAEMEALGADPDIYQKLTASVAPSIWQMDDVKKGILCQLFGGSSKEYSGGRVRGEINVLLVGDPGVSKSQLLSYVNKLAPRGIYTSGRGSSAVGLTAYVSKDQETKEMVLESGALVLSDRGICCIDEFDKMSDAARSMLHEVMEQQTVSVAKAGIIATLNARTSVLASANPVGSRYNPRLSIVDNIHLPPSLISRFDLIYLVLDKAEEATDRKLARHLLSLHYERGQNAAQAPIPIDQLRDFIAYARGNCHPELCAEAATDIVDGYMHMRRMGSSRKTITATPRQLESLIRISESLARMRLSRTVERSDAAEALRLMQVALQQAATDPVTGAIDMDLIQTGVSASERVARAQLAQEIKTLLISKPHGMTFDELTKAVQEQATVTVDQGQVRRAVDTILEDVAVLGNQIKHKSAVSA
ncbi:g1382 [Coccomyxa viridis]|uniref:DNA replication licensing factor MCM4 n=1 Tax=Coccomyxa viridis TaxID=1274662 RepID=A0ABP1FKT0_9CHLO